jgi:hypothetical protein
MQTFQIFKQSRSVQGGFVHGEHPGDDCCEAQFGHPAPPLPACKSGIYKNGCCNYISSTV